MEEGLELKKKKCWKGLVEEGLINLTNNVFHNHYGVALRKHLVALYATKNDFFFKKISLNMQKIKTICSIKKIIKF